jgi:nucleoside-diphosphate kinase
MTQFTLAIIKPDAVAAGRVGQIVSMQESAGMTIVCLVSRLLTRAETDSLYREHVGRDWYEAHARFMTSGVSVAQILGGRDVVRRWREMLGASDPTKAEDGTVRRRFGVDAPRNAAHGSATEEAALEEMRALFSDADAALMIRQQLATVIRDLGSAWGLRPATLWQRVADAVADRETRRLDALEPTISTRLRTLVAETSSGWKVDEDVAWRALAEMAEHRRG